MHDSTCPVLELAEQQGLLQEPEITHILIEMHAESCLATELSQSMDRMKGHQYIECISAC